MDDPRSLLAKAEFPRSSRYEPDWVMRHQMGPNPLWLAEWLGQAMALKPDMRVLDLGCGKALTSLFLAREHAVSVWAVDLWVDPTDSWLRVKEMGLEQRIMPLRAEAHALPFAEGFLDAAVSFDA